MPAAEIHALKWLDGGLWWLGAGVVLRLSAEGELVEELVLPGGNDHEMLALDGSTGVVAVLGHGDASARVWRIEPATSSMMAFDVELDAPLDFAVHASGVSVVGRDPDGVVTVETYDHDGALSWALPLESADARVDRRPYVGVRSDGRVVVLVAEHLAPSSPSSKYTFAVLTQAGDLELQTEVVPNGIPSNPSLPDEVVLATGADLQVRLAYATRDIQLLDIGLDGEPMAYGSLGARDYGLEEGLMMRDHVIADDGGSLILWVESRIGGEDSRVTTTRLETVDERWFDFGQTCSKANGAAISPTGTAYVAAPHRLIAIDRP